MWKLVIANKRYSSWSMRPWLVMRAFDIAFEEVIIPLRRPESKALVLEHSPSGRVPALVTPDITIWESLAIIEFLADSFPDKPIWPTDRLARARARTISNEMHGGFMPLRQGCPMDVAARYQTPELTDALARDVQRIETIFAETRAGFGKNGPYLFGDFTAADAMFAPVVTRFQSYGLDVSAATRAYMTTILADPHVTEWRDAGLNETWTIDDYASGHTMIENFSRTREASHG